MRIFGNKNVIEKVTLMLENGRRAHSFLLYGDKGLGKKTLARYVAMKILCEAEDSPCGKCFHCRNVSNNTHPDMFIVEHSGKTNSISTETTRKVCNEAVIKPNYSSKVFIFEDANVMDTTAQNVLLKSIEEPPDYAYYIFTANSRDTFLPTILSRVVSMRVTECSDKECMQALQSMDYTQAQIDDALSRFHGNVGNCIDYLNRGELFKAVDIVKRFTNSLLNRDEYELLKVFTDLNVKNKDTTKDILSIMDKHIRDVVAVKVGCNTPAGCYFEGAKMLSSRLTVKSCNNIHLLIRRAFYEIDSNVNMNLIISSLCGNVIQNV